MPPSPMRERSLFDAASDRGDGPSGADSSDTREAVRDTTTPRRDSGESARPSGAVHHLIGRLERDRKRRGYRTFHPRDDRMWVSREGGTYTLSVHQGQEEFTLSEDGVRQLGGLLDVPKSLLDRLSALPNAKIEDCRLLNMVLWAEGARDDARFRLRLDGSEVVAARSGRFTPLSNLELARELADRQQRGELRVKWYDLDGDVLRLEIEHSHLDPLDLSPDLPGDREATPDLWQPGAVLLHAPSGGLAVTVFPALFRHWGDLTLSVAASKEDIRKQRHTATSEASLLRSVLGDVSATREAPFQEAGGCLESLHVDMIPGKGVHTFLSGLSLPFPNKASSRQVVARVTTGRPSVFRLVTATLTAAKEVDDLARRHRLELATGRLVWSRASGR